MIKRIATVILLGCFLLPCRAQQDYMHETKTEKDKRMQWWKDARFGMFIHWGLYAVPAGEWKGATNHAEWIRTTAQIPLEEYNHFTEQFNPVSFNAEAWVQMAKDAGMKYITITSKHHDGFCLWDSRQTDFDIMSTPFKRDVLKELADACRKIGGIKLCFYHSIMDWHHPDYNERRPWEKDRPVEGTDRQRYISYLKNQLKELVTNYGDIGVLWFDGEWEGFWKHEDGVDLYNYVRSLKPDIIINNRVDKGRGGMAGMTTSDGYAGDFGTPEQEIPETGLPGVYWESCMTMNNNWGYNKADKNFKSVKDLVQKLVDIASKGGNFLLNIGPKADGTFPQESIDRLKAIGNWMKVNGESIYGTSASPFEHIPWGRVTQKKAGDKTRLYLHVFDWPANGILQLSGLGNTPLRIYSLSNNEKLEFTSNENTVSVSVPAAAPDSLCTVIVAEISGNPLVYKSPVIQAYSDEFISDAEATISLPDAEKRIQIRYTTDGSEPTLQSKLYTGKIVISKPVLLKAKSFYNNKPVSGTTEKQFKKVQALPALSVMNPAPGLQAFYYKGDWNSMPVFRELKPEQSDIQPTVSPGTFHNKEKYGVVLEGYIRMSKAEVSTFYLSSDDGSMLYIDGQLVINNDGLHGMTEKKGSIALAAGYHTIRVEFFEKTGGDDLQLMMETKGEGRKAVPAGLLYH
ncbi:MAG: alpha-L-fucosidase [Chitinophagaceae bacterium]